MLNIERALEIAAQAHEHQYRKGTKIPYISHPFAVGMILLKYGCSEEVIIAGILHDTIEDTSLTLEDIQNEFGAKIAEFVRGASEENKELSWEERKQQTINHLAKSSLEVCMIVLADKIHNLRSIRRDIEILGEQAWERFKRGREKQEWYYRGIEKVLHSRVGQEPLFKEYAKELNHVFT